MCNSEPLVDAPYPTQLSLDSSPISPTSGSGRERRHSSGSAVSPTSSMRGEISRRNSGIRRPVSRQRAERIGRLASPTRPSLINTYTSSETPLADSPILGNIQISSSVQQQCCKYKEGNFSLPLIRYLNDPSYTTPGFTSACARVSVHDHDPLNCRIEEVEPEREMVEEGWERARRVVEACGKVVDLDVNAGEGRGFEK